MALGKQASICDPLSPNEPPPNTGVYKTHVTLTLPSYATACRLLVIFFKRKVPMKNENQKTLIQIISNCFSSNVHYFIIVPSQC